MGAAEPSRDAGADRPPASRVLVINGGKRIVWGGRAPVRAVRYMGTVVATRRHPVIRAFYRRLVAAGRPKTVALTACMRKLLTLLNAMMRTNTSWQQCSAPAHA